MKKMVMMLVMVVMMAMNITVANAAVIGEYEKNAILNGTYEVVSHKSFTNVEGVSMKEWSEPDWFGNQYRLYWYTDGTDGRNDQELVMLKYHMTRQELKAYKKANKK